jgi:hypothetical protein
MYADCCVISFANNRGNYYAGLDRLHQSMQEFGKCINFIGFRDEDSIGAPYHQDNPYAFKLYCFRKALKMGFTKILYVDASVFAVRDVYPIFNRIKEQGYLMQEAGHYLKDWCNELCREWYKLSTHELSTFLMYGNAGLLGLDFSNPIAEKFFFQWWHGMTMGMFRGDWSNHRHDMTVGSIIANRLGMQYIKGDQILQYSSIDWPPINDSIIFKANGL